jgi:hypothetical protein
VSRWADEDAIGLLSSAHPALADFLRGWTAPESLHGLSAYRWDRVLRVGRQSRLLASLAHRLAVTGRSDQLPSSVAEQLHAAQAAAREEERLLRWEVNRVERALLGTGVPLALLKGAAYTFAGLPPARGRVSSDLDILVPRSKLGVVESALRGHGWEPVPLDRYDERYYRAWMHELPPLRHRDRHTLVDVHHAILPPVGRITPNVDAMWLAAQRLPGSEIMTLGPADLVLHSVAHLFVGDVRNGLRDLTDIDCLLRHFGGVPGFLADLGARATRFGLHRQLFYAFRYASALLGCPVPAEMTASLRAWSPNRLTVRLMDRIVVASLAHPALGAGAADVAARAAALGRAHWLRMPVGLLARHTLTKTLRRCRDRGAEARA